MPAHAREYQRAAADPTAPAEGEARPGAPLLEDRHAHSPSASWAAPLIIGTRVPWRTLCCEFTGQTHERTHRSVLRDLLPWMREADVYGLVMMT